MGRLTELVDKIQAEQITVEEADKELLFLLGVSSSLNFGRTPNGRLMDSIYDYICVRSKEDAYWAFSFSEDSFVNNNEEIKGILPMREHAKKWWGVWVEINGEQTSFKRVREIHIETGK